MALCSDRDAESPPDQVTAALEGKVRAQQARIAELEASLRERPAPRAAREPSRPPVNEDLKRSLQARIKTCTKCVSGLRDLADEMAEELAELRTILAGL